MRVEIFSGVVGGHGFDIDAAFGGGDERDAAGAAIDQEREVKLARDGRVFHHIDVPHEPALRPGLWRDKRLPQHAVGLGVDFLNRLDELDAAPFASAAGVDLRLHDEDFAAEIASKRGRLLRTCRHSSIGHGRPVFPEQSLGLVFVNVHREVRRPRLRTAPVTIC